MRDAAYVADYTGVDIRHGWKATKIDVEQQILHGETSEGPQSLPWSDLVLATGARPKKIPAQPKHPRVRVFHGWDDVKPLKTGLMQGSIDHVCIIGGGLVGCELAEAFHSLWGAEVSLIEAEASVLPGVADPEVGFLVERHMRESGVALYTGAAVETIDAGDEGAVIRVGENQIECDTVVIAVGVEPNLDLARRAGLEIGSSGAIKVDRFMRTSSPHIWAAGDCVESLHRITGQPVYIPLGSLANRQGRSIANTLNGQNEAFPAVTGAMAVKAFDWNVAAVGCTAEQLKMEGINFRTMWFTGEAMPGYWPESKEIHILIHYEIGTQRVLGVQAVGECDVTKRVDTASHLMMRGATLKDLSEIEHAYAPPFSPAIDPLASAAFAAINQEQGLQSISPVADIEKLHVLDVRLADERENKSVKCPNLSEIEMGEIRRRHEELPDRPLLIVCARGTRSAEVARWLISQGREATYLGGGMNWRGGGGEDAAILNSQF